MSAENLFDKTSLPGLKRFLDLSAVRQRAYASNIANVSTPEYERKDARFDTELTRAGTRLKLQRTHPVHTPTGANAPSGIEVYRQPREDGSEGGVDLDEEMVALAENQLRFSLASRLAALRITGVRAAIHGRR